MSSRDTFLEKHQVCDLIMNVDNGISQMDMDSEELVITNFIDRLPEPAIQSPKQLWTGKQILEMFIPNKITLMKRGSDESHIMERSSLLTEDDTVFRLDRGRYISGRMDKRIVGTSHQSLIQIINADRNGRETLNFMSKLQRLADYFIQMRGFSVGINDTRIDEKIKFVMDDDMNNTRILVDEMVDDYRKAALTLSNQYQEKSGCYTSGKLYNIFTKPNHKRKLLEQNVQFEVNALRDKVGNIVKNDWIKMMHQDENRFGIMIDSGSKGTAINMTQINGVIGQQILRGSRFPLTWWGRTNTHSEFGDLAMESGGFIASTYRKGIKNPSQYFKHAAAGREGLVDTAVKTSDSGYQQRRIMKSQEDQIIYPDGTVRDRDGKIVQYCYGNDGMDGSRIENHNTTHCSLDNKQFQKQWGWTKDEWHTHTNILGNNGGRSEEEKYMNMEWDRLLEDRDFLRSIMEMNEKSRIDVLTTPIDMNRLIQNSKNQCDNWTEESYSQSIGDPNHKLVTVEQIYNDTENLFDRWIIVSRDPKIQYIATRCHKSIVNFYLSSKTMILKHNCTIQLWRTILKNLIDVYEKSAIQSGSPVGAESTQAINESSTQMTLNTFHFTGINNQKVSTGVPRLSELINITETKYPIMTLYMKRSCDLQEAESLARKIISMEMIDLIQRLDFVFDPNPFERSLIEKDCEYLEQWYSLHSLWRNVVPKNKDISPFQMRIVLRRQRMIKFDLSVSIIVKALEKTLNSGITNKIITLIVGVPNDSNMEETVIRIIPLEDRNMWVDIKEAIETNTSVVISNESDLNRYLFNLVDNNEMNTNTNTNTNTSTSTSTTDQPELESIVNKCVPRTRGRRRCKRKKSNPLDKIFSIIGNLKKVHVKGIKGIQEAVVQSVKSRSVHPEDGSIVAREEYVIQTTGCNIMDIFAMKEIDIRRSTSNDIREIAKILGINACRTALVRELTVVICSSGSFVDQRHISLLADTITHKGYLMSITRHGINKENDSPLKRASFEEIMNMMIKAGFFAEIDMIRGNTENIIMGSRIPSGTGFSTLTMDPFQLFKQKEKGMISEEIHETESYETSSEDSFDESPIFKSSSWIYEPTSPTW
jgi:DNA-directed RNA polymerase II subunit RPB1